MKAMGDAKTLGGLLAAIALVAACGDAGRSEYELAVSGDTDDPFPAAVVPETLRLTVEEIGDGLGDLRIDGAQPLSYDARRIVDGWRVGFPTLVGLEAVDPDDCAEPVIEVLGWVAIDLVGDHGEGTMDASIACGDATAHVVFAVSGDAI